LDYIIPLMVARVHRFFISKAEESMHSMNPLRDFDRRELVMEKTVVAWLTGYFNVGEGKRPISDWRDELKALSAEEKLELATGVAALESGVIK
jgi:hypothetical protein